MWWSKEKKNGTGDKNIKKPRKTTTNAAFADNRFCTTRLARAKEPPTKGRNKKWPVVYLSLARHRPASDAINTVSAAMSRRRCGWFYNVELLNSSCTAKKQLWRHLVQSPDDDWRETNNLEFPLRDSTCRAGGAPRVIRKHKFHTKFAYVNFTRRIVST